MAMLPEGSLVVKRTFLEFVTSPRAQASRARSFTDTHLLEKISWAAETECTPRECPELPKASPALTPAWPMTPTLDALCEPELGLANLDAAVNIATMWGPWDDAAGQEWLLPAAVWPGSPESEQLAYQQPWVWMPLTDLAESCAMQGACWPDSAMWPTSPGISSASTDVGSEVDSSSEAGDPKVQEGETRTTVMLRNIPSSLMRNSLLLLLEKLGFGGSFDMVYVPVDFSTGTGLGYAFVNLVSPAVVPAFWQAFDGLCEWGDVVSDKTCSISWSEPNQGLAAHIERYRNSPVMHPATPDEWKPALFAQGVRVEFPAPTKKIKAPKVRSKKMEAV